jgi:hypothetical protein
MLGPVFLHDMIGLGRRGRYFAVRALFAFACFVCLWVQWLASESPPDWYPDVRMNDPIQRAARFSSRFLEAFAWLQISGTLMLTPAFIGTAIAEERQRRTIDDLFTTSLSSAEIVLGKWLARSLSVLVVLTAGTAILNFATLFGGVDPVKIALLWGISVALLASVGALVTLTSTLCRTPMTALTAAYGVLAVLTLVIPAALVHLEQFLEWRTDVATALWVRQEFRPVLAWYSLRINPWSALIALTTLIHDDTVIPALLQFIVNHLLLAVILLTAAIALLRRHALNERTTARAGPIGRLALRPFPRPAVWDAGVLWKEWFDGARRWPTLRLLWRLLVIMILISFPMTPILSPSTTYETPP